VCDSLTYAKKLDFIVVDSGLVVDSVDYSAPNQPQNPNQPRSSPGWAHHGEPRRTTAHQGTTTPIGNTVGQRAVCWMTAH
jgi:hypothetical protein